MQSFVGRQSVGCGRLWRFVKSGHALVLFCEPASMDTHRLHASVAQSFLQHTAMHYNSVGYGIIVWRLHVFVKQLMVWSP
jgi:hypothetical protein